MTLRIAQALLPEGLVEDVLLAWDQTGRLTEVRPGRSTDGPLQPGIALPGLVNAHLHLELSWVDPTGLPVRKGLVPWVDALLERFRRSWPDPGDWERHAVAAADSLVAAGTAAVSDVSNTGGTAPLLAAVGLQGVVQHEYFTLDAPAIPPMVAEIEAHPLTVHDGVCVRPAPHAPYSSDPALMRAVVDWSSRHAQAPPASIHLAEDEEELHFLRDRSGAWPVQLDRLERDWAHWLAPGTGPVAWLADLGALGPDMLLVHGVLLTAAERGQIREAGASVCLCPRSNLAIGGRLPDVPGLLADGVPLCLGTDSLASSPDLDVLGEVPVLAQAFPDVPLERWLQLATAGGAQALGLSHLGALRVGTRPGLIQLHGDPLQSSPSRTLHASAGGA